MSEPPAGAEPAETDADPWVAYRASRVDLVLAPSQAPVARVLLRVLGETPPRASPDGRASASRLRLLDLRSRLLRERVFEDPRLLLHRLRRRGLLRERAGSPGDPWFEVPYPEELRRILAAAATVGGGPPLRHYAAVADERSEIRAMEAEFHGRLRTLLADRLPETLAFGEEFAVGRLSQYLRDLFGEELYLDSLIALLQQYALADAPLVAPTGRPTGSTGFSLALFGPPGTGKTFSIDDLVRGNSRTGVPAHGLPGRNRYCGGITPAQFLRVGASYSGRTFNFIVPEFNDWFRYRGMVEPLKLVMEQREVKWETTFGTVGPYTFRSYFSVNYNVRTGRSSGYDPTIADPNFAALEDRMLLRFRPMTAGYFRAVERSAERLELGELDFALSERIRDHLTLVHAIATGDPAVVDRFPRRTVRLEPALYERLRAVSERALDRGLPLTFSPRLRSRAVRLAGAATLVRALAGRPDEPLVVGAVEADLAARYYAEEIVAHGGNDGAAASGTLRRPRAAADGAASRLAAHR